METDTYAYIKHACYYKENTILTNEFLVVETLVFDINDEFLNQNI